MDNGLRLRELMEQWAQWRIRGFDIGIGWPRRTTLGRAMDGIPSTQCTLCHGRKQIPGHLVGALVPFMPCPRCKAEGKVKMDPSKIKANPAFIRSTSPGYEVDDPVSELIDRIVARDLKPKQKKVIITEYSFSGRQRDKAEHTCYSYSHYKKLLADGESIVEAALIQARHLRR